MTAPTLSVAWPTRGEVPFPSTASQQLCQQSWMWMLKAFLKDEIATGTTSTGYARPANSTWTCEGSSDGVTGAIDGTDRWTSTFTPSKLVQAAGGSPHSWIVLKSPASFGQGAPVWFLISYGQGSGVGYGFCVFSRTAFTGGNASNDPTSTTSVGMGTSTSSGSAFGVYVFESVFGTNMFAGFSVRSGGEFWFYTNRELTGRFFSAVSIQDRRNTQAGDTWPTVGIVHVVASGRGAMQSSAMSGASDVYSTRLYDGSLRSTSTLDSPTGLINNTTEKDVMANAWLTLPITHYDYTPSGKMGWRGNLQDCWWVGNPAVGAGYPRGDTTQTQMVVGNILIPSSVPAAL